MRLMTPPLPAASRPSKMHAHACSFLQAHPFLQLDQLELELRQLLARISNPWAASSAWSVRRRASTARSWRPPWRSRSARSHRMVLVLLGHRVPLGLSCAIVTIMRRRQAMSYPEISLHIDGAWGKGARGKCRAGAQSRDRRGDRHRAACRQRPISTVRSRRRRKASRSGARSSAHERYKLMRKAADNLRAPRRRDRRDA